MPKASRVGVDAAGGVNLGGGQVNIRLEGKLWVVVGDPNAAHGKAPHIPGPDNMAQGCPNIRIEGIRVCRAGHAAGCGHTISGSGNVSAE